MLVARPAPVRLSNRAGVWFLPACKCCDLAALLPVKLRLYIAFSTILILDCIQGGWKVLMVSLLYSPHHLFESAMTVLCS
jgi:hypothetical protein